MSLTIGHGPFGDQPAGRFDFAPPPAVRYVEEFPRRVRGELDGRTVIDSERVVLVHESGKLPRYAFPRDEVNEVAARPAPHDDGYVLVPWDAVDRWLEEDEVVEVHVRDPYHRIDTFATSRRVRISLDGIELADSDGALVLYETSLPPRWYLPAGDVRTDLLEHSSTVTRCAYKGTARHWSARIGDEVVPDVAWTYDEPRREAERVAGRICFYDERVDLSVDGTARDRPRTQWSR